MLGSSITASLPPGHVVGGLHVKRAPHGRVVVVEVVVIGTIGYFGKSLFRFQTLI